MLLNGLNHRKNSSYCYRNGNSEKDKDIDGNPLEHNMVAFVKVKDCGTIIIDGVEYLDPSNAPAIPLGYGLTHQGYTSFKKRKSKLGTKVFDVKTKEYIIAKEYLQCTSFYIHKGDVYTCSIRKTL